MKEITIEKNKYELIEDKDNCFDYDVFISRYTDYFEDYDYIVGDFAYNKLRLKGFCDKKNPKFNKINDFSSKKQYILDECAYNCRYFVLKRVKRS